MFQPVNHIVEADIKGFFDNVSHEKLLDFIRIRVKDTTLLNLIKKFLKAGYVDDGILVRSDMGTPQGSILSPMYCDRSRKGSFKVGRKTSRKKYTAKCRAMNAWLKAIRNQVKTKDWWKILIAKLRGHYQYYGVSENYDGIARFYKVAIRLVRKWMNRRSQKRKMNWDRFTKYLEHYPLPKPKIMHSFYVSPVR